MRNVIQKILSTVKIALAQSYLHRYNLTTLQSRLSQPLGGRLTSSLMQNMTLSNRDRKYNSEE
jgi:hypothetical protein